MSNIRALTRNDLSLNVDGSGQAKEYFDQVCALSAATINKNFDILFQQRPEIKELVFDNGDASIGMLKATVKAPRILIEPNQSTNTDPEIYYSIIFDKGDIYYPGSPTVNIDGWVITVVAKLDRMIASPQDAQDDDIRFPAEDALGEIQKTHIIPESDPTNPIKMRAGEYSIHRLFAAISETGWALPDPEKSTVPIGPAGMTLAEWEKQSTKNHSMAGKVKATLASWAADHQYSGFFTLGLEVSVPSPKDSSTDASPTFIPTGLRLQNYPFIDDGDYINMLKKNEVPRGIVDNELNCLVWCETCDGKDIPAKGKATIPYSGNLALSSPDPSKIVWGTFAMNGNLFFDKYLLKELKVFCLGTQVVPLTPKMYTRDKGNGPEACASVPVIACGSISKELSETDRKGLKVIPPDSSTDDYYAFTRDGIYEWSWHKKLAAPGSGEYIHYYGSGTPPGQKIYRKYATESEMCVNVQRIAGTNSLKICGKNVYQHWEGYYNNTNFPWKSQGNPDTVLWGKFAITSTWSLIVNLSPKGATSQSGVIKPVIEGLDSKKTMPNDMKVVVTDEHYNISKSHEDMVLIIKKNMAEALKSSTIFIENRFNSAGRFFYPGTGVLEFKEAHLSDTGHVYCNIDYKPPAEGRVRIHIPSAKFEYAKEQIIDPGKKEIPGRPITINIPLIKWTRSIDYDFTKKRAKLTLGADASTTSAAAFSYIRATMSQVRSLNGLGLFKEGVFEDKVEVLEREQEEKQAFEKEKREWEEKRDRILERARKRKEEEERLGKLQQQREEASREKQKIEEQRNNKKEELEELRRKEQLREKKDSDAEADAEFSNAEKFLVDQINNLNDEIEKLNGQIKTLDDQLKVKPKEEDEELGPEPQPKPAGPFVPTYSLKYQGVTNTYCTSLFVKPEVTGNDHLLYFTIWPKGKFPGNRKPRIPFSENPGVSRITLEIEGEVDQPGKYVMQLNESWNDPIMTNNPTKTELADTWLTVELKDGVREGRFAAVTQAEAEAIQGVKKTDN